MSMENQKRTMEHGISRRKFIGTAGAAVAGLSMGMAAGADKQKKLILGNGEHKHELITDWLTQPDNIKWGDTQGVAQDSKGRMYISHTVNAGSQSKDAICVFDKKGKFLSSWGSRVAGGGHGLDWRKEGKGEFLYHCDTAHRVVVKTDLDGKDIWEKGFPKETGVYKEKDPFIPTNVAFAPNGDFYVTDGYGSDWIMQYNIKGDLIRTFGGRGTEPGKVSNAHGIWVDNRGSEPLIAVADRGCPPIYHGHLRPFPV